MLFSHDIRHIKKRLKDLGYPNLSSYYRSERWKNFRERKKRWNASCFCCGSKDFLNLHHHTYRRLGNEKLEDVIWLCDYCHRQVHYLYKSMSGRWGRDWLRFACHRWKEMINQPAGVPTMATVPRSWAEKKVNGPKRKRRRRYREKENDKKGRTIIDLNANADLPVKSYKDDPFDFDSGYVIR